MTTTPTPTTDADPTPDPESTPDPAQDPAAEVARLRDELVKARKWEDRAKANADAVKELDKLRASTMTDQERAVAEAVATTRIEMQRQHAARLVLAEVRAAAAGRPVDIDALLEGLDPSRFLTDDFEPDVKAIQVWVDKVAPAAGPVIPPGFPDLGQGARTGGQQNMALNGDPLLDALKAQLGIS